VAEWSTETLDSIAELVTEKIDVGDLTSATYISTENMLPNRGGVEVAQKLPKSGKVNSFQPGDVLFSNIRTYFKKVWYAPWRGGASADVIVFRPRDTQKILNRFLYYLLSSDAFISATVVASKGTKMPRGDKDAMRSHEFYIPSLPVQQRIAEIMSTYDELIENSQRQIKILESMVLALYREWFIHFRFPGHESVPPVPHVDIPQGWAATPFEFLLSSMTGGDWGDEQSNGDTTEPVIVVRGTDFDEVAYGGQLRAPTRYIKPSSLTSRGLKVGDVIIENSINAKSRSVGTTLLVDEYVLKRLGQNAIAASFCKVLRPCNQEIAPLIHLHARHLREDGRMEYYQNVAANGIANFQAQRFSKEEHITLPTDEGKLAELLEPIASMFKNVAVLASKLAILRRTRDLLLPRLISGQIDVLRQEEEGAA